MSVATTGNSRGSLLRTYSKHEDEAQDRKLIKRVIQEEEVKEDREEGEDEPRAKGQKRAMRKRRA